MKHFFKREYRYYILYRRIDSEPIFNKNKVVIDEKVYFKIKPSIRYWYADPLWFYKDGNLSLYMECYDRFKRKGSIAEAAFRKNGVLGTPRVILDEPFHLSFPYTFSFMDHHYMIPECNSTNSIRIYRLNNNKWELYYTQKTNEKIVDAIVLHEGNNLFLVCGEKNKYKKLNVKSSLWRIENLSDKNETFIRKIKDVSDFSYTQRNAGYVCTKDNDYILKQISDESSYGKGIIVKRRIGDDDFEGEECCEIDIKRKKWMIGIHTYDYKMNYECIDLAENKYVIIARIIKALFVIKSKLFRSNEKLTSS